MSIRVPRLIAALLLLGLVTVACGQHPGVHVEGEQLAGGAQAGDDGLGDGSGTAAGGDIQLDGQAGSAGATDVADGGSAGGGGGGGDAGSTGGGDGDGAGDGGSGGGGDGEGDGGGQRQPQGQDRTGVDDDSITLGVHAPVTGAAPLPAEAFDEAGDLYWRWVTEEKGQTILGRDTVEVLFADDRYEPSKARQVCRELAAQVFMLVGAGGTDSIQSCGQLAGRTRIPYFSPGVTETGLEGNPWYFPASMTYRQQGELLAEMVAARFPDAKSAAIVTETPNFDGAVAGWERGVQQQGLDYETTLRHPRGQQGWYQDFANQLGDAGVDVLYINTSPLDYIRFAQVAADQGHDFQFVGVGVTMGLNDVLGNGCGSEGYVDGGIFFSPFPALEVIDEIDPEFRQAADRFGVEVTDLAMAAWGLAKAQHLLFQKYEQTFGNDLTREDFRAVVEQAGTIEGGIFPPVTYRPDVEFGGQAVHVLEADCASGQHRNGGINKSGF